VETVPARRSLKRGTALRRERAVFASATDWIDRKDHETT
jgi:hypothetical protein